MNDPTTNYYEGFNQYDVAELFNTLHWHSSTKQHMVVANDFPLVVQEFSRPLFDMIPDISLHVCRTIFNTDLRGGAS